MDLIFHLLTLTTEAFSLNTFLEPSAILQHVSNVLKVLAGQIDVKRTINALSQLRCLPPSLFQFSWINPFLLPYMHNSTCVIAAMNFWGSALS